MIDELTQLGFTREWTDLDQHKHVYAARVRNFISLLIGTEDGLPNQADKDATVWFANASSDDEIIFAVTPSHTLAAAIELLRSEGYLTK